MYKIQKYKENELTFYKLVSSNLTSWLTVCPERGGIITEFGTEGEEHLYLNKETLYDRYIRGRIPILFPISGQLTNKEYNWNGRTYHMPNHGLARQPEWNVISTDIKSTLASITISFQSNHETLEYYPFDFKVIFTYTLKNNQLIIDQTYRNESPAAMPIYSGFHPYFKTQSKKLVLDTDATKIYDYNDEKLKDFHGVVDRTVLKEAVVLLDAKSKQISLEIDESKKITLTTDPSFKYTILWTDQEKDFICLEPWMAKTGELERKEELTMIDPGEALEARVSFEVEKYNKNT
ncbi:aldose epimerase [Jeotgalibacillus proteolyticus]|uniref:Aldose epimerase n=1 Tax=Jeotgalibacillus proteolyticus TaxID=2082395 RepID=A0A2S5GCA9_9BACL|nr:aldose epimerase [Jeotgalibacillus proteolyticus]PPA70533.1 aldose epimerase [Jeotgalibacillus proteolyticus]